ncbi:MAG: glutathione metabolism protein [Rhodoferax sp.]|nr:glutathione metabolism protein [Rhodoferax sp.]OIP24424.1 MAG: glutathione metabolism protein [Comamonadaceae bacterium CG2_30_60_41]PIW07097.1 MAG: glutathione metabolism protein [Comamonadaceae bacterium CG17_big_fil_post_rev_8_21_14_2_50_60_13]PIY25391.1 MAG: glutathione metabolism protein [Comamonadaceae bacterium CG_4_10_14_3_um_filter_60_75]PJC12088.1 MAG: glutathione metabolism protein [Comamonadaceae bacterium CG_4_9_14_0_8_um_filter_60_18]
MTTHFTLAYWCVFVVALLPIVCAGAAKWGKFTTPRRDGGFDNDNPRAWLARQTDWRARANAAQANSFEAMPFFIGAVVIAHQLGAYQARVDLLAAVYVVLRVIYILMYLANLANLRSVVWALALAVNVAILFAGYH